MIISIIIKVSLVRYDSWKKKRKKENGSYLLHSRDLNPVRVLDQYAAAETPTSHTSRRSRAQALYTARSRKRRRKLWYKKWRRRGGGE